MPRPPLRARKQPRQARSRETVAALLEAAAQVFERHGYAAGTTNRIAARAGVSIGSLYQYFPSKDAILLAIVERHVDDGAAALAPLLAGLAGAPPPSAGGASAAAPSAPPPRLRDGLRALVEAMVALHADRPGLHRVLFEEAPRPPALRRRLDQLAEAAADAVAAYLRASPEVHVADPALAARLVVQTVESITHTLVIHPAPARTPAAYVDATVDMLAAYLTAEPLRPSR